MGGGIDRRVPSITACADLRFGPIPPPAHRSDDGPVDHRPDLEEACKPKCQKFIEATRLARPGSKDATQAATQGRAPTCGAASICVAPKLFKDTK